MDGRASSVLARAVVLCNRRIALEMPQAMAVDARQQKPSIAKNGDFINSHRLRHGTLPSHPLPADPRHLLAARQFQAGAAQIPANRHRHDGMKQKAGRSRRRRRRFRAGASHSTRPIWQGGDEGLNATERSKICTDGGATLFDTSEVYGYQSVKGPYLRLGAAALASQRAR